MNSDLMLKLALVCVVLLPALWCMGDAAAAGTTEVLKWKDGKRAVFLLAYDDSCPTHITNAIPALEQRDLVGTFYTTPAGGGYSGQRALWHHLAATPAVELGNHTYTHKGVKTVEELEEDIARANEEIRLAEPNRKWPRLVSFARPGGVPWEVPAEQVNAVLARHHLVSRPPFSGPPFTYKTIEEMHKLLDDTLAKGEMGHLDFHGVGGDWHVVPMDYYQALLDRLAEQRDLFWVTDHITYHKYLKQREASTVSVKRTAGDELRLELACDLDTNLYDLPLTLQTRVPQGWARCAVVQDGRRIVVPVVDGRIQYDAARGEVIITPANP